MSATYLLLHSPLVGAVTWQGVADALRRRGFPASVPSITDDDRPPYAERWADRAAALAPPGPLVLVPHSGAGALVPLLVSRLGAERARAVVYVDAMLPGYDGDSRLDLLARDDADFAASLRAALGRGERFPAWTAADLSDEVPDAAPRAALVASLRPRGLDFFTEPIAAPPTSPPIACYLRLSPPYAAAARDATRSGWPVVRRDARHFAPIAAPDALAADLLAFEVDGAAPGLRGAIGRHRHELLARAVRAHAPDLVRHLDADPAELGPEVLDALRDAVGTELCAAGFGPDSSPDDHGRRCEDLIDVLAPWNWAAGSP